MDSMLVQYLGFIVAALILIWAVIVLNKHLSRRDTSDTRSFKSWVELDTKHPVAREEQVHQQGVEEDEEAPELSIRARQNGHHSSQPGE